MLSSLNLKWYEIICETLSIALFLLNRILLTTVLVKDSEHDLRSSLYFVLHIKHSQKDEIHEYCPALELLPAAKADTVPPFTPSLSGSGNGRRGRPTSTLSLSGMGQRPHRFICPTPPPPPSSPLLDPGEDTELW